jgi:hypothetical protein
MREARVMASLRHEHLVPIIDSGQNQLDSDIRYYIIANGVFLVQLADSTYTSGVIAIFATTDGIKQADVVYGNLKVYPIA